eukprot:scaffold36408_cov53-Attheya_sp.AAC.7
MKSRDRSNLTCLDCSLAYLESSLVAYQYDVLAELLLQVHQQNKSEEIISDDEQKSQSPACRMCFSHVAVTQSCSAVIVGDGLPRMDLLYLSLLPVVNRRQQEVSKLF